MGQFKIDSSYTLFVDRDGVINEDVPHGYVNTWEEFKFYDGVKEAFKIFAATFKYIIIITNQRGVGRGITKIEQLYIIHQNMVKEIALAGGRIDGIYFCTDINENSPNRKPNPGMAFQAKKDFPDIDFARSVMVGNSSSDMYFGRNIGAKTIFITTTIPHAPSPQTLVDGIYGSLYQFAKTI